MRDKGSRCAAKIVATRSSCRHLLLAEIGKTSDGDLQCPRQNTGEPKPTHTVQFRVTIDWPSESVDGGSVALSKSGIMSANTQNPRSVAVEIEGGRHPRNARFKDRHVNKLTRNELMKAIEKINCRGCAGRREVAVDDGKRRLVLASLRYLDTFVKMDGSRLFAERRLHVNWLEERALSRPPPM
jgi:hypothetical protein